MVRLHLWLTEERVRIGELQIEAGGRLLLLSEQLLMQKRERVDVRWLLLLLLLHLLVMILL